MEDSVSSVAETIRPDKLLRELDQLWITLGHQGDASDQEGAVLRACAMTLIVIQEGPESELQDTGETLAQLMRDHPARAVVLHAAHDNQQRLEAGVRAQCWMPFGKRQQICCELIQITGSDANLIDIPPVIASLTAPDLPIVIWSRSRRILSAPELAPVLRLADKLVIDSAGVVDLREFLGYVRSAESAGTVVAELAWTRLTRWRESIAKLFDDPANLERTRQVDKIRIEYQGETVPMSAFYVAGWVRFSLGRSVPHEFSRAPGEFRRSRVQTVSLHTPDCELSITVAQDRAVELHTGTRETYTVFPQLGYYELLREELSILGKDPVYEGSRAIAVQLIG